MSTLFVLLPVHMSWVMWSKDARTLAVGQMPALAGAVSFCHFKTCTCHFFFTSSMHCMPFMHNWHRITLQSVFISKWCEIKELQIHFSQGGNKLNRDIHVETASFHDSITQWQPACNPGLLFVPMWLSVRAIQTAFQLMRTFQLDNVIRSFILRHLKSCFLLRDSKPCSSKTHVLGPDRNQ